MNYGPPFDNPELFSSRGSASCRPMPTSARPGQGEVRFRAAAAKTPRPSGAYAAFTIGNT